MIIFARHYLTQFNIKELVQTYTDNSIVELPDTPKHIRAFKDALPSEFNPSVVYASSMVRTHETAKMLGYKITDVISSVSELPMPEYENKSIWELNDEWLYSDSFNSCFSYHMDNLVYFWNNLDKNKDTLIFTHGITLRLMKHIIDNSKIPAYFPDIFKVNVGTLGLLIAEYDTDICLFNSRIQNIMEN